MHACLSYVFRSCFVHLPVAGVGYIRDWCRDRYVVVRITDHNTLAHGEQIACGLQFLTFALFPLTECWRVTRPKPGDYSDYSEETKRHYSETRKASKQITRGPLGFKMVLLSSEMVPLSSKMARRGSKTRPQTGGSFAGRSRVARGSAGRSRVADFSSRSGNSRVADPPGFGYILLYSITG